MFCRFLAFGQWVDYAKNIQALSKSKDAEAVVFNLFTISEMYQTEWRDLKRRV